MISLEFQVNADWFFGSVGSRRGMVPANHMNFVVPLESKIIVSTLDKSAFRPINACQASSSSSRNNFPGKSSICLTIENILKHSQACRLTLFFDYWINTNSYRQISYLI